MSLFKPFCWIIVFGVLGILVPPAARSEAVHPIDGIQQRVRDFLLTQYDGQAEPPAIQVGPLDPRLRLPACGVEVEVFLPNGARALGNTSVGVRCSGPRPWTVYLSASVRMFGEVLVASRFLPRDTILTAADLRAERRDLTTLPGEFETVPARLLGKQLRRSLPIGALIPPRAVATPLLIKRGERVTVLVRQTGMEISSSGIALSDAALGERLRVRNKASQQMIEGTVIAAHQIAVEP